VFSRCIWRSRVHICINQGHHHRWCVLYILRFVVSTQDRVIGLIILGIVLDLGGGPNHDRIGFRYWKHPGPFVNFDGITGSKGHFLGWWAVMTQAAFSFIGTEIVAVRIRLSYFFLVGT